MAGPTPRTISRWLWPVVIALLAILALVWWFSPSGNREGEVEDPIVTGELADPAAEEGGGPIGEGLPGDSVSDPGTPAEVDEAEASSPPVDTQPAEAVAVPVPPPAE